MLPDAKVEAVKKLQTDGRKVSFVGDGINDAPALAQADVGLAIGTGTDIAIESADVILMAGDLRGIPNALALPRKTMRNIGQNLFWAFFYNILLIPVAAGVLYPFFGILLSPILAAAAMGVSSVFVLSNALRLRTFRRPMETAGNRPSPVRAPAAAAQTGARHERPTPQVGSSRGRRALRCVALTLHPIARPDHSRPGTLGQMSLWRSSGRRYTRVVLIFDPSRAEVIYMNTMPPRGFPGASRTSREYRLKRDSYVWLAGSGYRHMTRGTLLSGYLLRRNEVYQKLVLETRDGVVNVNEEDVEPLGPS